jgi:hypothetical protein
LVVCVSDQIGHERVGLFDLPVSALRRRMPSRAASNRRRQRKSESG